MSDKITTAIEKIDSLRTFDGLFGKCDTVLRLRRDRYTTAERIEMIKRFTARCADKGLRDTMRKVYIRRVKEICK